MQSIKTIRQYKIATYIACLSVFVFFAYQYLIRLLPGITWEYIVNNLHITELEFGIFNAIYYFGYAGFQIPLSVLFTRYSPRYLFLIFILVTAGSNALLTFTHSYPASLFLRFLVGFSSATAFIGINRILTTYFKKKHYTLFVSWGTSIGIGSVILAEPTVIEKIKDIGIPSLTWILTIIGVLLAGITYLSLTFSSYAHADKDGGYDAHNTQFSWPMLRAIATSKTNVLLCIITVLLVGSLEGFADVWGIKFLSERYSILLPEAASIVSLFFAGFLAGSPLIALLSQYMAPSLLLIGASGGIAALFAIMLFIVQFHKFFLIFLMFGLGLLSAYQYVVFAMASEHSQKKSEFMITVAYLNTINMSGGFFFHAIIGWISDAARTLTWAQSIPHGNDILALSVIPLTAIISIIPAVMLHKHIQKSKKVRAMN